MDASGAAKGATNPLLKEARTPAVAGQKLTTTQTVLEVDLGVGPNPHLARSRGLPAGAQPMTVGNR